MTVYTPPQAELGKNAISRRVKALRAMNEAGGPQFKRYERGEQPSYQVKTLGGLTRDLATREVPAYVVAQADSYEGIRAHVQEALDDALANPDVKDRDGMVAAVLSALDARCGNSLASAAAYFNPDAQPTVATAIA